MLQLSTEQQNAVNIDGNQICILACAGSGKTTTLTRRIARLINDQDIDPSKIAAITFTVLAGDNLKYELSQILKDRSATSRMFIGTIHSFCFQLLIEERIISAEAFEPITESQQFILLTKNWTNWEVQKVDPDADKSYLIERLITSFDIIKMNNITRDDLKLCHPELDRLYEQYNQYLKDNGFIDFADMLTKVNYLLKNNAQIRTRYRERFPYLFIDEYQDVDPIQAEIVNIFNQGANVCIVGDDDQAIYQFRGADEKNIQDFSKAAGCITMLLNENRRCPKNVVTIAENNINKVRQRLQKSMFTNIAQGYIYIKQFQKLNDELGYITDTIKQLYSNKAISTYGQIGILLRSMASYGALYGNALKKADIPSISRGSRTLFATSEIEKLVAIIEWFASNEDTIEKLNILTPIFSSQINLEILSKVNKSSLLTENDFFQAKMLTNDWILFNNLHKLRIKYEERKFGSLLEMIHWFIEELGFFEPKNSMTIKYNIAQFTRIIGEYEKIQDNKNFRSLATFLKAYASKSYDEVNPPDMRENAVNILTIHQSKGLEFEYVFIPMLVEGRFPLERSGKRWLLEDKIFDAKRYLTSRDNERRLFYVACTRARKALYLLTSQDVGLTNYKSPSIFWKESSKIKLSDKNKIPEKPGKIRANENYLVSGYSALEYYLTCPYRYQIIVEYGLEFPQSVYFQFGKLIHDVLANINTAALKGKPLSQEQAINYLQKNFDLYYKNTNMRQYDIRKQQLRAIDAITSYYQHRSDWMCNLQGIEGDLIYSTNQALIKGRYDAIIRNKKENYTVIDYKTGQPHTGLHTDFQMQFYCLAINAQLKIKVDEAIIYYIEADKQIHYNADNKFLQAGQENITNTVKGIINKEFPAKPNKEICSQCEVKKICAYRNADTLN